MVWDTSLHSVGRKKSAEQLGFGIYAGESTLKFTPPETSHLEPTQPNRKNLAV